MKQLQIGDRIYLTYHNTIVWVITITTETKELKKVLALTRQLCGGMSF